MKMPKKLLGEGKFEGKSHAETKGGGGGGFPDINIVLSCHGSRAGAPDRCTYLGQGRGKRELLCFPSAACIWMRIWHCSDVCAVAIWKAWTDHGSASVTQPQHSLLLSGLSSRYNETFWDSVSGSDVSNNGPITLCNSEIAYIECWISGHLFL